MSPEAWAALAMVFILGAMSPGPSLAVILSNTISGGRVVRFEYENEDIYEVIDKVGISPLPPYIKRESEPKDKIRYQTIFADQRGAVAAPTAGLHFTEGLINRIHKEITIKIALLIIRKF